MTYLTIYDVLLLVASTCIATLFTTYKVMQLRSRRKAKANQRKVKFITL